MDKVDQYNYQKQINRLENRLAVLIEDKQDLEEDVGLKQVYIQKLEDLIQDYRIQNEQKSAENEILLKRLNYFDLEYERLQRQDEELSSLQEKLRIQEQEKIKLQNDFEIYEKHLRGQLNEKDSDIMVQRMSLERENKDLKNQVEGQKGQIDLYLGELRQIYIEVSEKDKKIFDLEKMILELQNKEQFYQQSIFELNEKMIGFQNQLEEQSQKSLFQNQEIQEEEEMYQYEKKLKNQNKLYEKQKMISWSDHLNILQNEEQRNVQKLFDLNARNLSASEKVRELQNRIHELEKERENQKLRLQSWEEMEKKIQQDLIQLGEIQTEENDLMTLLNKFQKAFLKEYNQRVNQDFIIANFKRELDKKMEPLQKQNQEFQKWIEKVNHLGELLQQRTQEYERVLEKLKNEQEQNNELQAKIQLKYKEIDFYKQDISLMTQQIKYTILFNKYLKIQILALQEFPEENSEILQNIKNKVLKEINDQQPLHSSFQYADVEELIEKNILLFRKLNDSN